MRPFGSFFRTLGPGSVASLLKIALDVAFLVLWFVAAVLALLAVAALFLPLDERVLTYQSGDAVRHIRLARPLVTLTLLALAAYVGGFGLILERLRRVFATLTQGDPFRPENSRRLRTIGLILAVVTFGQFAALMVAAMLLPGTIDRPNGLDLLTPGFAVLIVFVLAQVFREGARLRRDAELTI